MTNTMHRQGSVQSLMGDWVIFTHSAAGYNKIGSGPRHKKIAEIIWKHRPSNFGIGEFHQKKTHFVKELLNERSDSQWYKNGEPTEELRSMWRGLIDNMKEEHCYAVFSDLSNIQAAVKEIKEADLGISVCMNALHEQADVMLRECGIVRHSVEHSLGFCGNTKRLPAKEVLELSTMCGHGMVSYNLSKKMLDSVRLGQITPERAGEVLMKTCSCGIFNPVRAAQLIKDHIGLQ